MCSGEQQLVSRLRDGDTAALGDLFALHHDRLWRLVSFRMDRRLHGRVDADDVLQEAYLSAAQRVQHFLAEESMTVFVWLRLIVLQTMVDMHRQHLGAQMRDANREVSLQQGLPSQNTSASLVFQLLGHHTSPSQAAQRAELARQLENALELMDPIDREVLALRHFEELTNKEVAEVLQIEQKAASIRYVRAIKRLKGILATVPDFFDQQAGTGMIDQKSEKQS